MLGISNLSKRYRSTTEDVAAIEGITIDVKEGEFYTLLGPSGCGKTTMLQCIAGLVKPDFGAITMAGDIVFSSERQINVPGHRRNLGMVFQSYAIWPHLTVYDNVAFPLRYGRKRLPGPAVRDRVMRTLELVKLAGLEDRPAPRLSGGQQQRVALARAVVYEPALLLLDEPLSNLDASLRDEMQTELRTLVKRLGITAIYVTHDQKEALSMSDRIAVLQYGKVVQEGTPREIYHQPRNQFVAGFIGKSNFLRCRRVPGLCRGDTVVVETAHGPLTCTLATKYLDGADLLLVVRPEAIEIHTCPPSRPENVLAATVEDVSFVGEGINVFLRAGDSALLAKSDAFVPVTPGQVIHVRLPPERCMVLPSSEA